MTHATLPPSRRLVALGLPVLLAGCVTSRRSDLASASDIPEHIIAAYGPRPDERFPLPAIDLARVDPQFVRQLVPDPTGEPPGTLVVDPAARFLYLVRENRMALRYGVGVGREGLEWNGRAAIRRKAAWPRWTPTANMIARDPRNAQWTNGMEPSLDNPLGARALYLYEGTRDTLYRLHGTNEPRSIGRAVSSGCIRLFNQDAIDLYERVPIGTPVVVRPA